MKLSPPEEKATPTTENNRITEIKIEGKKWKNKLVNFVYFSVIFILINAKLKKILLKCFNIKNLSKKQKYKEPINFPQEW